MDHDRFDRLSKRVAAWPLSRRRAVRAFGAAGLAGSLVALRRGGAAADCPDITTCVGPCYWGSSGVYGCTPQFPIPGGPIGACWSWSALICKPCSGQSLADMDALCNQADPECRGRCKAG